MNRDLTTSPQASDQQLIDEYARTQSPEAFQAIVDRHARWIFAAAYRQLRDRQLAEDAAQTVFILLIQRSSSMKTYEKLSGWLFSTLQFTVKNIQRVQRRRQARERLAALERAEVEARPLLHADELHEQLDAAVAHLTGVDRSAILLRYYQDLSFEQIAQTLNISEAAARKRVTRAIDGLRRRLGAQITPATLSAATGFGLTHSPANLAQNIGHLAISAKAGAALPAGILSTTKGTVKLMIAAKLKVAALIAIGLAVSIPVAVVAVESTGNNQAALPATNPSAPAAVAADASATADAPDWMAEFKRIYSLGPDQVVKLVPPPFSDVRQQFLDQQRMSAGASLPPALIAAMRAQGINPSAFSAGPTTGPSPMASGAGGGGGMVMYAGTPSTAPSTVLITPGRTDASGGSSVTFRSSGMVVTPAPGRTGGGGFGAGGVVITGAGGTGRLMVQNGPPDAILLNQQDGQFKITTTSPPGARAAARGFTVSVITQMMLGLNYNQIDGDKTILNQVVPGDLVNSGTATQEQLRAALEKLLSDQLPDPVTLTFRDVDEPTYVLSGTWNYKPVDAFDAAATPLINIYDTDMEDKFGYSTGRGTTDALSNMLGQFINARVVIDAQGLPDVIDINTHRDGMAVQGKRDIDAVLNHITDQTGLTWKKEMRPVMHLVIEKAQ